MTDQTTSFVAIVLAAGAGTRMHSQTPKVLHPVAGLPMAARVAHACVAAGAQRVLMVIPEEGGEHRRALAGSRVEFVVQPVARGTGDAARCAFDVLGKTRDPVLVLAGDLPALRPATVLSLISAHRRERATLTVATMRVEDPAQYGRILRGEDGGLERIVEWAEASEEERAIQEVNTGLIVLEPGFAGGEGNGGKGPGALNDLAPAEGSGELYLTDLIELAKLEGHSILPWLVADPRECTGVNDRRALAQATLLLRDRAVEEALSLGVSMEDPGRVLLDPEVVLAPDLLMAPGVQVTGRSQIGRGTCLGPGVVLHDVLVGEDCVIGPYSVLERCSLDDRVRVGPRCHLVHAEVGAGAQVRTGSVVDGVDPKTGLARAEERVHIGPASDVGPMAHLRPGTTLDEAARVGNFVELKNTHLGRGSKAPHLSYLGDAEIGQSVNIGAGTITCNYDGFRKHRTVIEDRAFIGSDSQLVAPVTIHAGAYVGSGSTITKDVPADALVVSRGRLTVIEGWAARKRASMERRRKRPPRRRKAPPKDDS